MHANGLLKGNVRQKIDMNGMSLHAQIDAFKVSKVRMTTRARLSGGSHFSTHSQHECLQLTMTKDVR